MVNVLNREVVLSKDNIIDNLVFISGLTRSGKALLCPILSSYNNTEKVNVNFFLEQIPFLNFLGKIPDDTAIFLLKSGMNLMVYDNAISRNVNFRPDDYTSIFKYKNPLEYIQRLFQPDGDCVIESLSSNEKLFPMMVHNGLWHAEIWLKAFPLLKLIHMQRNPADIVFSWIGKGYGGDFYSNSRANVPTYEYKGKMLPYHIFGWEDQYLELNEVDRIIYMVDKIRRYHQETYDRLSENEKQRILFVRHEKLLIETEKTLSILSGFIGESPSNETDIILAQENCPRVIEPEERQLKLKSIKENSSSAAYDVLMEMTVQFELVDMAI